MYSSSIHTAIMKVTRSKCVCVTARLVSQASCSPPSLSSPACPASRATSNSAANTAACSPTVISNVSEVHLVLLDAFIERETVGGLSRCGAVFCCSRTTCLGLHTRHRCRHAWHGGWCSHIHSKCFQLEACAARGLVCRCTVQSMDAQHQC